MLIVIHRVNRIRDLKNIPVKYGVEIDVRGYGHKILLNHDPISDPDQDDELSEYLKNFKHAFIIFNIKEAGYEEKVIELAGKFGINNYFLLDPEFPFIYMATRKGYRKIALRYSEAEPIEFVEAQSRNGKPLVDWVWIDSNTKLPLNKNIVKKLEPYKTCLVCPERWGRTHDIGKFIDQIKKLKFKLDAVMTSLKSAEKWENLN